MEREIDRWFVLAATVLRSVHQTAVVGKIELFFPHTLVGHSLRDRVSSVTQEELGVKPLHFHIKRSRLKWHRQ